MAEVPSPVHVLAQASWATLCGTQLLIAEDLNSQQSWLGAATWTFGFLARSK